MDENQDQGGDEWLFVAIDSEQSLIGALLVSPQVYWKVCDRISETHFYDPCHAMIFREISGRMMSGTGISVISLAKALENQIPESLGGSKYIVSLAGKAATTISVPICADTIREMAIRRELTRAATDAMDACRDLSVENKVETIASNLESHIHEALTENTSRQRGAAIEEVALRLVTSAEQAAENGRQRGISSGLDAFDAVNGLMMPGDLVVIGGATSMGKTALAQQIVWNAAMSYTGDQHGRRETGARVAVFSMEMTAEQYAARHMAQITGIQTERMEGQILTADECRRMRGGAEQFKRLPMWIEDQRGLTIDRMRSICRRYQHTHGLDMVLIDHLHFIAKADKRMQGLEAIEANVSGLKSMALEIDCPVLLISHLNRGLWARDDKRPQLADLHGASAIEKDADAVCFIHREEYWLKRNEPHVGDGSDYADWEAAMRAVSGKAEIINGKRRRGRAGETGLCAFDAASTRFYDLARQA
jgi:replicative DNA helicase